jgi:hypothetical protein
MTVSFTTQAAGSRPIIISRPEEKIDTEILGNQLADLARRRRITARDERLLEHSSAVGVLTLEQIRRLLWPTAKAKTAADRLSKLWHWHLVRRTRQPWPRFAPVGLATGPVFGLGVGGWYWLHKTEPADYPYWLIEAAWVWRHLLAVEIYTRLSTDRTAIEWQPRWRGLPESFTAASPMTVLTLGASRTIALELPLAETFQLAPKLKAYDELAETNASFTVALVVPHTVPIEPLAADIAQRRRQPVIYLLAGWDALLAAPDLLNAPVWWAVERQPQFRRVALAEVLSG